MVKSTIVLFTMYFIVAHGLLDMFDGVHIVFRLVNLSFVLALILFFQILKKDRKLQSKGKRKLYVNAETKTTLEKGSFSDRMFFYQTDLVLLLSTTMVRKTSRCRPHRLIMSV